MSRRKIVAQHAGTAGQFSTCPSKENFEVFVPKDTRDQPFDVILVAGDVEFKAHKQILSKASPFFERLLNSEMKESKEGVVRLEMFTEAVMRNTLEFIYSGHVQISKADDAREMIVMADYLFLHNLKALAEGVLAQKLELNTSNCISNYYFFERYQSAELSSLAKKFVLANFASVAKTEAFMDLSSKEIEMWISNDEIDVNAEKDVFDVILAWINRDKNKRKKYFSELFSHVRLVYISRDFLCANIVTDDLVKDNNGCLDLVEEALKLIDSGNFDNPLITWPRKSLETSVLVSYGSKDVVCYIPHENKWYRMGEMPSKYIRNGPFFSCHGKLYGTVLESVATHEQYWKHVSYNPYSNNWMSLPSLEENRYMRQIFIKNEDEIYALEAEPCTFRSQNFDDFCRLHARRLFCDEEKHIFSITKYKPKSNSWELIATFDYLSSREDMCIVAQDNFVYFIGGIKWQQGNKCTLVSDVDRYHLGKNQWDKMANTQVVRDWTYGAAVCGKIFIAGGINAGGSVQPCEMYNPTTNEWQFIASFKGFDFRPKALRNLLSVDGNLYALFLVSVGPTKSDCRVKDLHVKVECYDPVQDKWSLKTEIAISVCHYTFINACSARIFKGFLNRDLLENCIPDFSIRSTTKELTSSCRKADQRKCFVM